MKQTQGNYLTEFPFKNKRLNLQSIDGPTPSPRDRLWRGTAAAIR